jgi:hypothetical protein
MPLDDLPRFSPTLSRRWLPASPHLQDRMPLCATKLAAPLPQAPYRERFSPVTPTGLRSQPETPPARSLARALAIFRSIEYNSTGLDRFCHVMGYEKELRRGEMANILIVEDEEQVRVLAVSVVEELGHTVQSAQTWTRRWRC